jgi:hypothetical protein
MKLTKSLSLFLALLLLVSNIGFAFNVHYCGKAISSVSLQTDLSSGNPAKNCCGAIEKKSRCCSDRVFHFQKKSDNAVVKAFSIPSLFIPVFEWQPVTHFSASNFESQFIAAYSCDSNAPPLFKLFSQYIFYDSFNV